MPKGITKHVIVQHSGYGYGNKEEFAKAIETRTVRTQREINAVERAGGLVFDSYIEAENFCEDPEIVGHNLVPVVRGTFSESVSIDGLAVYIPVRKVIG